MNIPMLPLATLCLMASLMFCVPLRANAESDESPSMELLEFLGEWQTQEGDWVDPMRFLNVSETDLERETLKQTSNADEVKEEQSDD